MTEADDAAAIWVTQVVNTNGRDLLRYFLRRVSSPDDAADLLGNLLVVVWRRKNSLPREPEQARMWCFGIARNELREHRRGHDRQIALADSLRRQLNVTTQAHATDPGHIAARDEQNTRLHAAIQRLDASSQELIALVHWDGFSLVDAAAHLRMNPSSARTRYSRARTKLAQLLEDQAPRTSNPTGRASIKMNRRRDIAAEGCHD